MGKRFLLSIIGVVCISIASCLEASAARENVLKVYNWADYMDESLLDEFEEWYLEETGERVKIIYQTFDLNEVALAKVERAKADYDLMCPSEYIIERMLKKDLLIPIIKDFGDTPNYLGNIAPYITATFDQISTPDKKANDYAVPFMWGTTGLLYNSRTVTRDEALSWAVIWDEKFLNRIFMKDAVRDVYGIVQIYINQDLISSGVPISEIVNDSSQESVERVAKHLVGVRNNVAGWEVDFGKEMMTKEKADISLSYSGDAVWAIEEGAEVGVELDYVVPKEGSIVWFDGWVIPKYAKNVKAASYFINFMCRPDNALRNMYEIGYVSAVATPEILEAIEDETIEEYSDLRYLFGDGADSVRVDNVQYPDVSVIERCAMSRDFGDRTEAMMIMWATVKGDNLSIEMIAVIVVTAIAIIIYYLYQYYTAYTRRRYRKRRK